MQACGCNVGPGERRERESCTTNYRTSEAERVLEAVLLAVLEPELDCVCSGRKARRKACRGSKSAARALPAPEGSARVCTRTLTEDAVSLAL